MDHRLPLNGAVNLSAAQDSGASTNDIGLRDLTPSAPREDALVLLIQNTSFGWNPDKSPEVNDITFTLSKGKVCFVIGPVGSGKSTLLKGILGETPSSKGFVYNGTDSIAYNDQTPWIQNATIKQNILGISNFEEQWYNEVVHACSLELDISKLPKGHGRAKPKCMILKIWD
jgi:ATP-binding cassette subfamily C (CFTR/MRP) protein 1